MQNSFACKNCKKVVGNVAIGSHHRNHCSYCLWSLHVDKNTSGDRYDTCQEVMEPIGLTFKHEGVDKYGNEKQGEITIVHKCKKCGKVSINRIAGDDDPQEILKIFKKSSQFPVLSDSKVGQQIELLGKEDKKEVERQLFGNKS